MRIIPHDTCFLKKESGVGGTEREDRGQKQSPDPAGPGCPPSPSPWVTQAVLWQPPGHNGEDELSPGGVELGPFSPDSSLSVFFLAQETFCLLV